MSVTPWHATTSKLSEKLQVNIQPSGRWFRGATLLSLSSVVGGFHRSIMIDVWTFAKMFSLYNNYNHTLHDYNYAAARNRLSFVH